MAEFVQFDMLHAVETAYFENDGTLSQKELYEAVANKLNINPSEHYGKVGKQENVNMFYRACRWVQQSMKEKRLLENVSRGVWTLAGTAKERLHVIQEGKSVIAMSTNLGIMICSKTEAVFESGIIEGDIDLVLTSPPYILQNPRNYGGLSEAKEWVKFIMSVLRPIIPRMSDGASLCLNIGQDSFHKKMPARQTHIERLTIELEDEGLWLVDRLLWTSNKAPGPAQYTSIERQMLRSAYEPLLHFTNNPLKLMSNNQRVLQPHTDTHKKFVTSGGTRKAARNSDGAHRKSVGDYSKTDLTKGKIPTNNLYFGNKCGRNELVNKYARMLGIPTHGAKMPFRLAKFLVEYLCPVGGLAVDPFGGTGTMGEACQVTGRKWVTIEPIYQYVRQSFIRFKSLGDDCYINPAFIANNPMEEDNFAANFFAANKMDRSQLSGCFAA